MIQKFIRNNACLVYGTLAWNYDRRVTRRTKIKIDRRRRSRLSLFVVEAVGEVDSGIKGGPHQAVSYCRRNRCLQKAMYAPANAAVNILIPVTVEGRFVCIYCSSGWDDSCTWRAGCGPMHVTTGITLNRWTWQWGGSKVAYSLRFALILKQVKVAHSLGFRNWSRFLAVSLQVARVINPAVGCHYFPPVPQLPPQPLRGLQPCCYQFHCLVNRGAMGVNSFV